MGMMNKRNDLQEKIDKLERELNNQKKKSKNTRITILVVFVMSLILNNLNISAENSYSSNEVSYDNTNSSGLTSPNVQGALDGLYQAATDYNDIKTNKADKSATVSNVAWDSTNKKLTKTINGTTSDVVTGATILGGLTSSQVTTALGYTPPTADTNTWRGIQNNLTSTSTTDSLSAYQGKLLNDNKMAAKPTSIEFNMTGGLSGYGGFLDFHYNGSTADYTSRIIEDGSGVLNLQASNGVKINGTNIDTKISNAVSGKANTASPGLTGTPTAPTAAAGTNSTQIATTAFVTTAVSNAHANSGMKTLNSNYTTYYQKKGDIVTVYVGYGNKSTAKDTLIGTLPSGYRPYVDATARNQYDNQPGSCMVQSDGKVYFRAYSSNTTATYVKCVVTYIAYY